MLVQAGFQTHGRGQMGSIWEAQSGENLTFSVYLQPERWPLNSPWHLSMWVATALCQTIQSLLPQAQVKIKWPNDILIQDKKVAGILVENSFRGDHWYSSEIGIGWNIHQQQFNPQFLATSMGLNGAKSADLLEYLGIFLETWEGLLTQSIQPMYLNRLWRWNEWQTLRLGEENRTGCIRNVEKGGRLVVEWEDGTLGSYGLKELQFLR